MTGRYPKIIPLDRRPPHGVSDAHWKRLRDVQRTVRARTGCSIYVDAHSGRVLFGYAGRDGDLRTPWQSPLYRGGRVPNRFDALTDGESVDDVCRLIQLARVPDKQKRYWEAIHNQRESSRRERDRQRDAEDMAPEWMERTRIMDAKSGMHSGYKRSLVVDGLKQTA